MGKGDIVMVVLVQEKQICPLFRFLSLVVNKHATQRNVRNQSAC